MEFRSVGKRLGTSGVRDKSRSWRRVACVALALVMSTVLLVPPANAELEHPRQQWMRDSTAGLFLHWGMFTAPRHYDCDEWEQAVNDGGWDADYWVEEAKKLRASYIVLATFHSRLGYARPWPSEIPGSCAPDRDYLGELIEAAESEGVKVLLYMTDDPQWHDEHGVETLDSQAYSEYKGQQVDLTTRDGFGMYSYDLFFEVMDNYPDLGGFWIDNDNAYWEEHNLYEQIREIRPSWLLSNNNEDTPIMDTVSNEQKTGITPEYDYPQAVKTPMPRLAEACYKLPTRGAWWYEGKDEAVDRRLNVGRYISNAGSSVKSLIAETAMVNGRFPASQESFNDFMDGWLPEIWSSIEGTEGGGYMHGGMQPGFWNDGSHGVITVDRDAKVQYVHVLTRPENQNRIRLRDNGYKVTGVTDVRTGQEMAFNQSGGHLTILGIDNWDPYDTVFKVQTAGQQFFYDQSTIEASASASKDGHPASNLTDGSFWDHWDSDATLPVSMTLDLGEQRRAAYLAINQREWSPTHERDTFGRPEDSARIKDYRVYVSDDGEHWGEPVRTGTMESARGVRFIDIGRQHTRYLRLEVLSTWAGPQAPQFFEELKIDEVRVAQDYPYSASNPLPYEAEAKSNELSGTAKVARCAACSGGAQVTGLGGGEANSVSVKDVQADEADDYRLDIDYTASGEGALQVSVNGGAPTEVAVAGQGSDVVTSTATSVPLRAGTNTVTLSGAGVEGLGVDRISVGPLPPESYVPDTTVSVQPSDVWLGAGQRSFEVTAEFRTDEVNPIDHVRFAPVAPEGWTVEGPVVRASRMHSGERLEGSWTLTAPSGDSGVSEVPVKASFQMLGRSYSNEESVQVQALPDGRVFMREGESTTNTFSGSAGADNCSQCSGGAKVRHIGNSPNNYVTFPDVTVEEAGEYELFIDYTVSGSRSFFVTINGGTPVEVPVSGDSWDVPTTESVTVSLEAGANTIKVHNDDAYAPDLDRIALG